MDVREYWLIAAGLVGLLGLSFTPNLGRPESPVYCSFLFIGMMAFADYAGDSPAWLYTIPIASLFAFGIILIARARKRVEPM